MKEWFDRKIFKDITVIFFLFFIFPVSIIQGNSSVLANSIDFAVRTVIPENQLREASFYDLLTEPGMAQTVRAHIYNRSAEDIVVRVDLGSAGTNEHGSIDYEQQLTEYEEASLFKFEDIVSTKEYIEIEGGGVYPLDIYIQMPEEAYDGVIAGGIGFTQVLEEEQVSQVGIRNTFSYRVAMLLWQGDRSIEPAPNIGNVTAYEVGRGLVEVTANIQNQAATFLYQMRMDVQIYTADGQELLHEYHRSAMQMAPNSNFDYTITVPDGMLKQDESYLLSMVIQGEKERAWELVQLTFTVLAPPTLDEAAEQKIIDEVREPKVVDKILELEEMVESGKVVEESIQPWWRVPVVALVVFVMLGVVLLVFYRRKLKKEKEKLLQQKRTLLLRLMGAE